jgi:hypothetical protein
VGTDYSLLSVGGCSSGVSQWGRFYRPSRLKLVSGLWPAVTFVAAIDGRIASYICPTGRDWLRGWTIGLGVRPAGLLAALTLDIRCTASDCHGPLDTRANGPPMARSLMVPAVARSQRAEFQGRPCLLVPIVDVTAARTLSSGGWPAAPGETATPATRMPARLAWLITWLFVRITRAVRGSRV